VPKSAVNPIVLYDGICGLCNRLIQFLLKRDVHDRFRFAPLQSEFADSLLRRHGVSAIDLDTVYVVVDHGRSTERLLARSDAMLLVLRELGGIWSAARLGTIVPRFIRNRLYDLVARNRYRIFGKHDTCMLPEKRYQHKFLDLAGITSQVASRTK
jgi:predicted DCC family thiol-disulfide oxidoreductase YuxK